MRTSEQINEIAEAMALAQAEIKPATKDAVNPAYRSKYADLTAVWSAIRGPLSKHKIAVWQDTELVADVGVAVTTRLAHASGQWVEFGPLTVPCAKKDAHGVGSAASYAKRYAIAAAVGVVAEDDDDGNEASQKPAPPVETTAPRTTRPIPTGAVLLQKTEQHKTSAGKPYWLLVLTTGEEIIEWKEQQAIFAEQACQDGLPVVITTSGGQWDGKPVVRTILRADQIDKPKKKTETKELTAEEIPF
jgi:hypothetical protein